MKLTIIRSLATFAAILLSLPAAAQYVGFNAAITKQVDPVNANENAIVELGTLIPKQYELKFNSLVTPAGVAFKGVQSPAMDCSSGECRQYFTMALDAQSSGKCNLNGNYVARFDVACNNPQDGSCKPGQHEISFSLQSANFCTENSVATANLWQQLKGIFASDVGSGGMNSEWWFLNAARSVAGGFDVVSMDLNLTAGMRRNGGAVRIDVDGQGNAFVANDKGEMFRFANNGWARLPGIATDVGIGANGAAWCVGANAVAGGFGIYRWNGNGWDDMKGGAVRIDVDPQGNAWVVNSAGQVWRYTGSGWAGVPGISARDVGIGANGSVFVVGQNGSAYKWDGNAWVNRGGNNLTDITVTANGVPIAINVAREVWVGQP